MEIKKVASICSGVIGYSWALRFAMSGCEVWAQNRTPESSAKAQERVKASLFKFEQNSVYSEEECEEILRRIHFTSSIEEAVSGAAFIQESTKELLELKHSVIDKIEKSAAPDAVIASSTSGLLISDIARPALHPERIIGGHPYNPPHLIPLVEITKGEFASEAFVKAGKDFYKSIGMEPVVLNKEVKGFICNRLQNALFREAADLVMNGVCSVEDVDKAVTFGPGLRWAIMGPNLVFELGGGSMGIEGLIKALAGVSNAQLADMANWTEMPLEYAKIAQDGVNQALANRTPSEGNTHETLEAYRDRMLMEILMLHGKL